MSTPRKKKSPKARVSSRLRVHPITASDTKTMILGAANVIAGVFGFFDELEKGTLTGDALRKEIARGKRRAKALRDAEAEVVDVLADDDAAT